MFLIPPETLKSFKRIMHELYKKCCDANFRIIPEKLPELIRAGEAAWLVMSAKCKTVYLSASAQEEAEGIHADIGRRYYQRFEGITSSDFAMDFDNKPHLDFIMTREALLEMLNSESDYAGLLATPVEQTDDPPPSSKSIKSERAKPLIAGYLMDWVEFLVKHTEYDTYQKFEDIMINTYFQKNPREEVEKFKEGNKIIDVFCRRNLEGKYTIYFNVENELEEAGPLRHRALSSFKRIFNTVRSNLRSLPSRS